MEVSFNTSQVVIVVRIFSQKQIAPERDSKLPPAVNSPSREHRIVKTLRKMAKKGERREVSLAVFLVNSCVVSFRSKTFSSPKGTCAVIRFEGSRGCETHPAAMSFQPEAAEVAVEVTMP